MERPLYMEDSYLKEFQATVKSVKDGKFIVLDKTAFYPKGGGQPCDTGKMVRESDRAEFRVVYTGKFSGQISHEVENPKKGKSQTGSDSNSPPALKEGDKVKCTIDWDRRYRLMRMHTAAHILFGVIRKETGARITGNQLDVDRSRIDFDLEDFDKDRMRDFIDKSNQIVDRDLPVKIYFMPRDEALKKPELFSLRDVLPPNVKELRIMEIKGFDLSADGGTHVKSTKEVGHLKYLNAKNKGKDRRRVYFTLE